MSQDPKKSGGHQNKKFQDSQDKKNQAVNKFASYVEKSESQIGMLKNTTVSNELEQEDIDQKINFLENQKELNQKIVELLKSGIVAEQDDDEDKDKDEDKDGVGDEVGYGIQTGSSRTLRFESREEAEKFIKMEQDFLKNLGIPNDTEWTDSHHCLTKIYMPLGFKGCDPHTMSGEEMLEMNKAMQNQTFDFETKKWSSREQEVEGQDWQTRYPSKANQNGSWVKFANEQGRSSGSSEIGHP